MKIETKKIARTEKGFTLIELVIVMAIIGIMTVVTLSLVDKNRPVRAAEVGVREFSAAIREAQNYALTGRQGLYSSEKVCGWGVFYTPHVGGTLNSLTKYRIFYNTEAVDDCSINTGYDAAYSVGLEDRELQDRARFQMGVAPDKVIYFSIPHGNLSPDPGLNPPDPVVIEVSDGDGDLADTSDGDGNNPVTGTDHSVCVYSSGKVSDIKGSVTPCPI